MLKAAMITPSLAIGGAERWVIDLIQNTNHAISWKTAVSGWGMIDNSLVSELSLLCPVYGNRPIARFNGLDIALTNNNFDKIEITGSDFRKTLEIATKDCDVIVTWAVPKIGELLNTTKPIVYVSHTDKKSSEQIVGQTHQIGVSKVALNHFHNKHLPTDVIWNGANPRLTSKANQEALKKSWKIDRSIVGQIGRHVPLKNYMLVAESLANQTCFGLVNYGMNTVTKNICQDLVEYCAGNLDSYSLNMPIHNIGDAIVGFDVMIIPSTNEANSLSTIEAWLCKVPTISTRVGAIDEFEERFGQMTYSIPQSIAPSDLFDVIHDIMSETHSSSNSEYIENIYQIATKNMSTKAMGDRWVEYLFNI